MWEEYRSRIVTQKNIKKDRHHADFNQRAGMKTLSWMTWPGVLIWIMISLSGCFGKSPLPDAEMSDSALLQAEEKRSAEFDRVQAAEDLIVIGVSQVGSESVWRTANTESIQTVFTKENGYFLLFSNARQKQENQIKALRSFISQRVDYIVLSPLTEEGWDTVLQEAKEAGIPVILIDRKVNVEDPTLYTAWVGSDFYKEGRHAGEALEQVLRRQHRQDESIRIVILRGTKGGTATIGRSAGFEEMSAKHENWLLLEQADGEFTTAKGQEEMEKLLHKYSDIDVVIAQNDDMAFGAVEAIKKAGLTAGEDGDILLISFDATRNALKLVEQGVITADIECNPNQGIYVDEIIRKLRNQKPVAKLYFVPEEVYTKYNVKKVLKARNY